VLLAWPGKIKGHTPQDAGLAGAHSRNAVMQTVFLVPQASQSSPCVRHRHCRLDRGKDIAVPHRSDGYFDATSPPKARHIAGGRVGSNPLVPSDPEVAAERNWGQDVIAQRYVGQIIAVGFNFAPVGRLLCNGQTLSISGYEVL
jgi:hypothetical protein